MISMYVHNVAGVRRKKNHIVYEIWPHFFFRIYAPLPPAVAAAAVAAACFHFLQTQSSTHFLVYLLTASVFISLATHFAGIDNIFMRL